MCREDRRKVCIRGKERFWVKVMYLWEKQEGISVFVMLLS